MDDIVTEVTETRQGAVVIVNDTQKLRFSRSVWRERSLAPGESVDLEELRAWLLPRQYTEALNLAVGFLAVRARSAQEVRRRLESKGYMDDTVDMVLYKLEQNELLDDESFAREFAQSRANRQLGRARIVRELRQKGVDAELAERVVGELDAEASGEAAEAVASKLLARYASDEPRKRVSKTLAGMARRGYAYDEASEAIARAIRNIE